MKGGEATDLKKYKSNGEFELITFDADREVNTYRQVFSGLVGHKSVKSKPDQ